MLNKPEKYTDLIWTEHAILALVLDTRKRKSIVEDDAVLAKHVVLPIISNSEIQFKDLREKAKQ